MSAAYELIAKAILEKKAISATYQNRYREMCPHTLGYKNDKEHALMYQFGGDSKSGLSPGGSGEKLALCLRRSAEQCQVTGRREVAHSAEPFPPPILCGRCSGRSGVLSTHPYMPLLSEWTFAIPSRFSGSPARCRSQRVGPTSCC